MVTTKGILLIPERIDFIQRLRPACAPILPLVWEEVDKADRGPKGDMTAGFSLFTDLVSLRHRGVSDNTTYTFLPSLKLSFMCFSEQNQRSGIFLLIQGQVIYIVFIYTATVMPVDFLC